LGKSERLWALSCRAPENIFRDGVPLVDEADECTFAVRCVSANLNGDVVPLESFGDESVSRTIGCLDAELVSALMDEDESDDLTAVMGNAGLLTNMGFDVCATHRSTGTNTSSANTSAIHTQPLCGWLLKMVCLRGAVGVFCHSCQRLLIGICAI